ncbi:MFS transporter [Burkholderia gladioli]|uniref:MFS transporter n=1 Tax=Burkholderia gladioli TaxID=28095 RepID=UPI000F811F26
MTTLSSTTTQAGSARLPLAALLALAMTGFVCIMTETLPAGLLPQMVAGLDISTSLAGQTVTAYAAGSLLAAIPLTIATQRWRRRKVLLLTLAGFLVFNSLTALSDNYALTLLARLLAGASAGLAWSLLAGYARRMVPVRQQGRAMAVAMVGTPIALSLGVPLGTWLGGAIGWRSAFAIMSVLSLVLIAWVLAKVPDYPGQAGHQRMPLRKVLVTPGVRRVLGVVIAWMLAHNLLYTYVAPFAALAGQARHVDLVLLVFGLAALAGIAVTSRLVDRHLRAAVLASLAGFALVALLFAGFATLPAVLYGGAAAWGLSFGGAATLLQTALADNAGDGADVALSMNVVAWNGAIAGGGLLGGVLLDAWGAASFAPALVLLLAIGFVTAWCGSAHGFRPGPRHIEGH